MRVIVGPIERIAALVADVHRAMGYPKFGYDVVTGREILPLEEQAPEDVPGVTLGYCSPIVSQSTAGFAAYPYDSATRAVIDAMRARGEFIDLKEQELPDDF